MFLLSNGDAARDSALSTGKGAFASLIRMSPLMADAAIDGDGGVLPGRGSSTKEELGEGFPRTACAFISSDF